MVIPVVGAYSKADALTKAMGSRFVATLLANSSLLVVSGQGMGKSTLARFVAEDLRARGFPVAVVPHKTVKQVLIDIAEQLRLGPSSLDGKTQTTAQLQTTIADDLKRRTAFLLFDDAHPLPVVLRAWLIELMDAGANFVLFATHPPKQDGAFSLIETGQELACR